MEKNIFKKTFLFVILAVVLLGGLNLFQKNVRNVVYFTSAPIQEFFWNLGDSLSTSFKTIYEIGGLKENNEKLERENREMIARIAELEETEEENKFLREGLELGLEKKFDLILAKIVSREASGDFILINKGAQHQVLKGMIAIDSSNVLAGEIAEVYENFSAIRLLSDKESSFSGKIKKEEDIQGIIQGQGRLKASFIRIPRDAEILEEDIIITDGLDGRAPAGFLIGKIEKIEKSDVESFQEADISLFFDINGAKNLFIITEKPIDFKK